MRLNDWLRVMFLMQTADGGTGGDAGDGAGAGGDAGESGSGEGTGTGDAAGGEGSGESGSEGGSGDGGDGGESGAGSAMTGKTGDEGSGDAGGEGKPDAGTGAPESYTQFELPQGMEVSQGQLDAATPVFKEMGLTQENAQKLINLQAAEVTRQSEAWQAETSGWLTELKADKDIGGAKFGESVKAVSTFIKTHAGDGFKELSEFLDLGYGNYPPLFKLIHSMAMRTSEDSFNGPGDRGTGDKSEKAQLKKLYPTMPDSSFVDAG